MELKGSVESIIFRNEENGYTVIYFDADGKLIVAVGIFPIISPGEVLKLKGEYKFNTKFGEQFAVESVEFVKPEDAESIRKYLASGLFRGVGEVTANLIVDKFGTKTLEIIENNPDELTKIRGIGKKTANEIAKCYKENNKVKDIILFLQNYGISISLALKIYKQYEDASLAVIKENPYCIIDDIEGVGFATADKLAAKLGVEKDSLFRLKAAIIHVLKEASQKNGHTYLPKASAFKEAAYLTGIYDQERMELALETQPDGVISSEIEGQEILSLTSIYNTEKSLAAKLVTLKNLSQETDINIDEEILHFEKTNRIVLDPKQRQAVESGLNNGVVIITGGPGTGKTMIIKCISSILSQRGKKVALCAPTGRAAKRMSEATGEEAKTLHRLLGGGGNGFEYNEYNPLEADVIIVDEISMADIFIFNALLIAVTPGAKLILVGDKDQLPAVACGNILADMLSSNLFCAVYLNEIYRQAKESMIVVNAHRINNSQMPVTKNSKDFFIDNKSDPESIKDAIISMAARRIPNFLEIHQRDIQVLSPMKKGVAGVESLNAELQRVLNPHGKELVRNHNVFRVGDKVMQTVNNYSLEWIRTQEGLERGEGVFNGDIGYIIDIEQGRLIVEFEDGKKVVYENEDLDQLMTAYCISVHKSQGSEFPVVIIAVTSGNYAILTKNLLYTAVTRAKKMAVIVGDEKNIEKMIKNNYTAKRYTLLKHFLSEQESKYIKLWGV